MTDQYISALLHCNGEHEGTVYTDETEKTWTYADDVVITSNVWKKFGLTSFDMGNDDRSIISESSTDFAFSTGDFTFEAVVKPRDWNSGAFWLFTIKEVQGDTVFFLTGTDRELAFYQRTDNVYVYSGLMVPDDGEGHFVVMERESGSIKFLLDGVMGRVTKNDFTERTLGSEACLMAVGGMNGFIDEIRISKGIARYHDEYLPAVSAFDTLSPALITVQLDGVDNYVIIGEHPKQLTAISVELLNLANSEEAIGIEGYITEKPNPNNPSGINIQLREKVIMRMDLATAVRIAELINDFAGMGRG